MRSSSRARSASRCTSRRTGSLKADVFVLIYANDLASTLHGSTRFIVPASLRRAALPVRPHSPTEPFRGRSAARGWSRLAGQDARARAWCCPPTCQGWALLDAIRRAPATDYLLVEPSGQVYDVLATRDVGPSPGYNRA